MSRSILLRAMAVMALLTAVGNIQANDIFVGFSGSLASNMTDTYGYFGSAGTVYTSGTPFELDFAFDPSDCSTHSIGATSDAFSNCVSSSMTAGFTFNGVTISIPAADDPTEALASSFDGGTQFEYFIGDNQISDPNWVDFVFDSSDPYVLGELANGPPVAIVSASFSVCSAYKTNCDTDTEANLAAVSAATPEPASFGLMGISLAVLSCYAFVRRRRIA